jgi:hypothetical protein
MYYKDSASITIAIADGDTLVGHALKLGLQNLGYEVRPLKEILSTNGAANPFEGIDLVLLPPRLSKAYREAVLKAQDDNDTPKTGPVVALELAPVTDKTQDERVWRVLWPCRMKDLKREIEAALLNGSPLARKRDGKDLQIQDISA